MSDSWTNVEDRGEAQGRLLGRRERRQKEDKVRNHDERGRE